MTDRQIQAPPTGEVPLSSIWWGVFAVVLLFGGIFADGADRDMVWSNIGDGRDELLLAVAIHTFPLTLSFFLIVLLWMESDRRAEGHPLLLAGLCAGIFWVCGKLSSYSGLGIPPDEQGFVIAGSIYHVALSAFAAYLNVYGWPLTICAFALGVAGAISAERSLR
jgi:heme/copper-type cytochrome/quinol oxidase subunit 3